MCMTTLPANPFFKVAKRPVATHTLSGPCQEGMSAAADFVYLSIHEPICLQ
jgi:hypothetical protein